MAATFDILGQLDGNTTDQSTNTTKIEHDFSSDKMYLDYLKSIDDAVQKLVKHSDSASQSAARNSIPRKDEYYAAQSQRTNGSRKRNSAAFGSHSYATRSAGRVLDDFVDSFERELIESIVGSDFKEHIARSMRGLASMLGVELQDVPRQLGKNLGRTAGNIFNQSDFGRSVTSAFNDIKNQTMSSVSAKFKDIVDQRDSSGDAWRRFMDGYNSSGRARSNNFKDADNGKFDADISKNVPSPNSDTFQWDTVNVLAGTVVITSSKDDKVSDRTSMTDNLADSIDKVSGIVSEHSSLLSSGAGMLSIFADASTLLSNRSRFDIGKSSSRFNVDKSSFTDAIFENIPDPSNLSDIADVGTDLIPQVSKNVPKLFSDLSGSLSSLVTKVPQLGNVMNIASGVGGKLVGTLTSMSSAGVGAAAGTAGFAAILGPAAIALAAVVAGLFLLDKIVDALGPAIEGTKQMFETMSDSANRFQKSREKNIELAQKRLADDVEAMLEEPFNILEDAANRVYEVWDANLRTITATQGYTKADTQELMSAYAERLRKENLSSVVSSGDITENLAKVIDSGLHGKIAEEFAYIATLLNSAIPTEDFFSYGDVYASIAANAMAAGKSQSEAIAEANQELSIFASNLLYASRQITGGVATGLQDAHNLFESSVQIAHASKNGVASEISSVLTAVSATVGAIAPDLATSMIDVIVKAATGGNASELVALRSLAGINASNSEFLNALATDPKKVFSTLFYNLAQTQNGLSQENYMEVAEGLSDIFGIPMESFQRIDFAYLADAISSMNINSNELSKNISLLRSGETTLTSEQLRYQQINEYMIKEGLAYVLDNEVARSIQEHMWEEQLARELMESTYAVELKGSALEFLEGIRQTIENILSIFSPAMWFKKAVNLVGTAAESYAQEGDIARLLQAGKIGTGNYQDFYNLTTRNADLNLTDSLLSQLGSFSGYEATSTLRGITSFLSNPGAIATYAKLELVPYVKGAVAATVDAITSVIPDSGVSSKYDWKTVGKSVSTAMDYVAANSEYRMPSTNAGGLMDSKALNSTAMASSRTASLVEQLVNQVDSYKSYGDWESAARDLGIVDIDTALESTGRSVNMIKDYYQSKAAKEASDDMVARYADEQDFRDKGRTEWEEEKQFRDVTIPAFWDEERAVWEDEKLFRDVTLPAFWEEERLFWTDQRAVWDEERKFRDVTIPAFWDEERAVWESERIFREETLPARWVLQDQAWQRDADFYELAGGYLKTLDGNLKSFYDDWVDYFVNFTAYSERYSFDDVEKIQKEEKDGQSSAIYALAQALTQNTVDLKDPTLQTNALLSQILILVNTIVQQTNDQTSGAGSIAETLAGLALGLVK